MATLSSVQVSTRSGELAAMVCECTHSALVATLQRADLLAIDGFAAFAAIGQGLVAAMVVKNTTQ
jgi:hypothetical protein